MTNIIGLLHTLSQLFQIFTPADRYFKSPLSFDFEFNNINTETQLLFSEAFR